MGTHRLELSRATLRDSFDNSFPSVLTIDPGDTVSYRTLDAGWGSAQERFGGRAREIAAEPGLEKGHALSGPIYVRGAEPGDALGIEILELQPSSWGWTWAGPRPQNHRFNMDVTEEFGYSWKIGEDGWARNAETGLRVVTRPFMGVMGNAPVALGRHTTTPPRRVGGNIDCRELIAGSTLFLPVEVEGALFSVGDGHAAQGDGEVGQTAIECGMDRVVLRFSVRKDLTLDFPAADTPAGYVTLGFGPTLDDAAPIALRAMLEHVMAKFNLRREQALALCSLAVDLHVTQVVNGDTWGVHAVLPPDRVDR